MTDRFIKLPIEALSDARLSHRDLRVLMALYSFGANPGDVVWPSRETLSELSKLHWTHVSVSVKRLQEFGWILTKKGGQQGNSYTLLKPGKVAESAMVAETATVAESVIKGSQNGYPLYRTDQEQTKDLVIPPNPPRRDTGELFARFWAAYPLKRSKGTAERAFAKLKPNEPLLAEILVGLERAKTSDPRFTGGEYIPYPATWLNAKGWQDEAAPGIPKPATSAAYGQPPRQAHSNRNGAHHATPTRPDNSAPGKIARAIAARDAARKPATAGGGYAGDDCIELGSSDYRAVAH